MLRGFDEVPSRNVDARPLTWRICQHRRLNRMPDPWAILALTWMRAAADNLGRIEGDPDLLAAQVFPLRPDVDGERMAGLLQMMHDYGVAFWYVGPDGEQYVQIAPDLWFDLDQKLVGNMRQTSSFPDPPADEYQEWLAARLKGATVSTRANAFEHVQTRSDTSNKFPEGKGRETEGKGREESTTYERVPPRANAFEHVHTGAPAGAGAVPPTSVSEVAATSDKPKRHASTKATAERKVTPEQKALVDMLWQYLKAKDALPASASKAGGGSFYWQLVAQAERLLAVRPLEAWQECFKWATEESDYWPRHLQNLRQLGDLVWPQYARVRGVNGGAPGHSGRGRGAGAGAGASGYNRLVE